MIISPAVNDLLCQHRKYCITYLPYTWGMHTFNRPLYLVRQDYIDRSGIEGVPYSVWEVWLSHREVHSFQLLPKKEFLTIEDALNYASDPHNQEIWKALD